LSLPRYPAYKDSGVEWLGKIPVGWDVVRLKNSLKQRITDGPHTTPVFTGDGVPFLSVDGIQDGELVFDGCRFVSIEDHEEFRKKAYPKRNDLLIGKAASTGKIARVKVDFEFSIWSPLALLRIDGNLSNPTFVEYMLKSPISQAEIDNLCTANTQKNISMDDIPRLLLTRPPLHEQVVIAAFLDRETAKINALVAEQQRLIELLKEKRQAVISHAVTKGLNPDAPLKPSGVEWLGDVPEQWSVRTIAKASTKITNGYVGPTRDILVDTGVPYIQATHIKSGRINFDDGYFVMPEWSKGHAKSILAEEDVLIVQTGAGTGDVGLVSNGEVGFNCHALIIVTTNQSVLRGAFLSAVLQSAYGQEKLASIRTGAMHPHLNCGEVKYVEIPLPPLIEQAEIVAHIRDTAARFDALIAEAGIAIALLQERRSALISAAVTGQIDVRGLAQQEAA
jgi:type I restriction enzyme S subunit